MGKAIQDQYTGMGTSQQRQRWRDREWCNEQSKQSNTKRRLERPEQHLFFIARIRARKRGLEFSIDLSDIIIPEICPIRKVKLSFDGPISNSPSLDRVDNTKGYSKDNIRVISRRANVWKNDMSIENIKTLYDYALRHI